MKNFSELNASEAVTLYQSMNLDEVANDIIKNNENSNLDSVQWPWNREPKAWEHSSYAFGFVPENDSSDQNLSIFEARSISADESLKNSQVTISLDYLRAYDYPGKGKHRVLFKFSAKNYVNESSEQDFSFNQTFAIEEGQRAPISGYPIFVGLTTGNHLLQFDVEMVNVSNDNDDKLLETLENGVVKNGVTLINSINPILPILTEYATGITKLIASRNRNREITAPKMGLYFGKTPSHLKIAKGLYIALQISDPGNFDWSQWKYDRNFGTIRSKDGIHSDLPYNYFAFSISEMNK